MQIIPVVGYFNSAAVCRGECPAKRRCTDLRTQHLASSDKSIKKCLFVKGKEL